MKTAERILVTSLALFNRHGEHNVSSVDIALELDISPGNLYYHFKGKEVIVAALFDLYRNKLDKTLVAAGAKQLSVEEFFYFLLLLLEQGLLFQFLYHYPIDLAENHPNVAKNFTRQLTSQQKCIEKLLRHFVATKQLQANEQQMMQMCELIGLVFSQAVNYYAFKAEQLDEQTSSYRSLSIILFALTPYFTMQQADLQQLQQSIASQSLHSEALDFAPA